MDQKIHTDLERAVKHLYEWRLKEAYTIFKRYYDRLPFKPERGHLKYIGMFVRTLFELGKNRELQFYVTTLESIYERTKAPEIGYQLAFLYIDENHSNIKLAKNILESILNDSEIAEYKNKARMLLAYCYDVLHQDVASVRKLIESVDGDLDPSTEHLLITWKAKVLRDEGKFLEAQNILIEFLNEVPIELDWYPHLTGRLTLAYTYFQMGKHIKAQDELTITRNLIKNKPARSIENRIRLIEEKLAESTSTYSLVVHEDKFSSKVILNGKAHEMTGDKKVDLLFLTLMKKKYLSKASIVESLYDKSYAQDRDDQIIYSAIHSVRRLMNRIGLPKESIESDNGGYRFTPEVEFIQEKL